MVRLNGSITFLISIHNFYKVESIRKHYFARIQNCVSHSILSGMLYLVQACHSGFRFFHIAAFFRNIDFPRRFYNPTYRAKAWSQAIITRICGHVLFYPYIRSCLMIITANNSPPMDIGQLPEPKIVSFKKPRTRKIQTGFLFFIDKL